VILNAAGGECVDDFAHLRSDAGLAELVGSIGSTLEIRPESRATRKLSARPLG
jgi:hypothetical protein